MPRLEAWSTLNHYCGHRHRHHDHYHYHHTHCPQQDLRIEKSSSASPASSKNHHHHHDWAGLRLQTWDLRLGPDLIIAVAIVILIILIIIIILGPDLIITVGIVIIVLNKTWDFKDIIIIVTSTIISWSWSSSSFIIIITIIIITMIEWTQGCRLQTWDLRLGRDLIGASSESIGSQICRGKHFYPNSADFDTFYICSQICGRNFFSLVQLSVT